jgi:hypothetical protein
VYPSNLWSHILHDQLAVKTLPDESVPKKEEKKEKENPMSPFLLATCPSSASFRPQSLFSNTISDQIVDTNTDPNSDSDSDSDLDWECNTQPEWNSQLEWEKANEMKKAKDPFKNFQKEISPRRANEFKEFQDALKKEQRALEYDMSFRHEYKKQGCTVFHKKEAKEYQSYLCNLELDLLLPDANSKCLNLFWSSLLQLFTTFNHEIDQLEFPSRFVHTTAYPLYHKSLYLRFLVVNHTKWFCSSSAQLPHFKSGASLFNWRDYQNNQNSHFNIWEIITSYIDDDHRVPFFYNLVIHVETPLSRSTPLKMLFRHISIPKDIDNILSPERIISMLKSRTHLTLYTMKRLDPFMYFAFFLESFQTFVKHISSWQKYQQQNQESTKSSLLGYLLNFLSCFAGNDRFKTEFLDGKISFLIKNEKTVYGSKPNVSTGKKLETISPEIDFNFNYFFVQPLKQVNSVFENLKKIFINSIYITTNDPFPRKNRLNRKCDHFNKLNAILLSEFLKHSTGRDWIHHKLPQRWFCQKFGPVSKHKMSEEQKRPTSCEKCQQECTSFGYGTPELIYNEIFQIYPNIVAHYQKLDQNPVETI